MGNIAPDIRPGGIPQGALAGVLYQIVDAIKTICAQLDDDATVNDADYEANCYTAIFTTVIIEDLADNRLGASSGGDGWVLSPRGLSDAGVLELLYQIFDSFETLCEQLDADAGVTDETYEANCYTAKFLWMVENQRGNTLGNGNTFWFRPGGVIHEGELLKLLYAMVDAIETLTEQLDADAGVTNETYEALCYTAKILYKIDDGVHATVVGN